VADFNNDGNLDIAVVDAVSNLLTVWIGDGKGNFTAKPPLTGFFAGPAANGDFDGDGNFDIAVKVAPTIARVYFGVGDGTFSALVSIDDSSMDPFGSGVSVLAAVDLNGDGHSDLVFSGPANPNLFQVSTVLDAYFSGNSRTFTPTGFGTAFDGGSYAIVLADVNGDGWPDVIVPSNFQLIEMLSN